MDIVIDGQDCAVREIYKRLAAVKWDESGEEDQYLSELGMTTGQVQVR
jgi:hypothetical protein